MIEAALALVRTKGPRGFTLNEASRMAGVSVSAPYNHFKDKEALLIEIVLLGNRTLEEELRQAASQGHSAGEKLTQVFLAYIHFASRHPDLFAVMFHSGIDKSRYPQVAASAAKAFAVAGELASVIERTAHVAQQLSIAIWTMAHGYATLASESAIARIGGAETDAMAKSLVSRLLPAVEPRAD